MFSLKWIDLNLLLTFLILIDLKIEIVKYPSKVNLFSFYYMYYGKGGDAQSFVWPPLKLWCYLSCHIEISAKDGHFVTAFNLG